MKYFLIITTLLFLTACGNNSDYVKTIENNGYEDVVVDGTRFFFSSWVCGDDAIYGKKFTAKINNRNVEGYLCIRGWFIKNPYVRVD